MRSYDEMAKEYYNLSNKELANEFNVVNSYVNLVWGNIDDETSDRLEVLSDMIHERFIAEYADSYMFMINPKVNPEWLKGE